MAWFKVISHTNVCIDHQNGSVVPMPYGTVFEADPSNPDVRRFMTRFSPPKVVAVEMPEEGAVIKKALAKPAPSLPVPSQQAPAEPSLPPGLNDIARSDSRSSRTAKK